MEGNVRLARPTLDELPLNVAIVAADGEIVQTNRGWRNFGEHAGRQTGDVGRNYFDAASDDDRAVQGIKEVIEGRRDVFAHEYPCHTPEERMWFLMRVTRFESGSEPYAVVAHIDITERKLAQLETEHVLERIDGLVTDLTAELVAARTRDEVEQGIVRAFEAAPQYDAALIGRHDRVTEEIKASVGGSAPVEGPWDASGDSAVGRALSERSVQVVEQLDEDASWASDAIEDGYTTFAAVPLVGNETSYGVLIVFSRTPGVFDEREQRLLRALGRIAGTATRAVETARALTATSVVEIEVETTSADLVFSRLSEALECTMRFRGTVQDADGPLVFFDIEGVDPETVFTWARDEPAIEDITVIRTDGERALVEFRFRDTTLLTRLADEGVETTALAVEDGTAHFTFVVPADRDTREVLDLFPDDREVQLLAQRHRDRPRRTPREIWASVTNDLTSRQQTALTKAYVGGFFDWPRQTTGDDLADSMDITRSTFHQHLRAAEAKVLEAFFEYPN